MRYFNFVKLVKSVVLKNCAHSRQYATGKILKYWHLRRLYNTLKEINKIVHKFDIKTTIDTGSSDALVTRLIKDQYPHIQSIASDFKRYPVSHVNEDDFIIVDLLDSKHTSERFDLVTCFETLEHVGNLKTAISNLIDLVNLNGILFITVPVEVGFYGILKTFPKLFTNHYKFNELCCSRVSYFISLFTGHSSNKRNELDHYGYHFGFSHKKLLKILYNNNSLCVVSVKTTLSTCSIILKKI